MYTLKFFYYFILDDNCDDDADAATDYDDDDDDDGGHDYLTVVTKTKGTEMKRWKGNLEIFPRQPLLALPAGKKSKLPASVTRLQ